MSGREHSAPWAWRVALWTLLAAACEREPVAAAGAKGITSLRAAPAACAAPAASVAPFPGPDRPCPKFADPPKWGHGSEQSTIALSPPVESRTVELRGDGVLLSFGFREFLRAAECLNRRLVVDYLRSRPQSEQVVNISDQKEAQFVVPAAALLDAGHAAVIAQGSGKRADTIVKSFWTWMGCGGGCRHMGREYRLSIPGDVFFQITDATAHARRLPEATSGAKAH